MKHLLLFLVLICGCSHKTAPQPTLYGASSGPDHQGTGINITINNSDQAAAASGPDIVVQSTGGIIATQVTGDGGTNAYGSKGILPILADEVCFGYDGGVISCAFVVGPTVTTDGGVNNLITHTLATGTSRVVTVTTIGFNNCGLSDSQTCTLQAFITVPSDGGGSVMNPSSPICSNAGGAPAFT